MMLSTLSISIIQFPFCTTLLKLQNFHLFIVFTNQCPLSGQFLIVLSTHLLCAQVFTEIMHYRVQLRGRNEPKISKYKIIENHTNQMYYTSLNLTRQHLGQTQRKLELVIQKTSSIMNLPLSSNFYGPHRSSLNQVIKTTLFSR